MAILGGGVKTAAIAFSKICGSLEGWQNLRVPSPFLLKKSRFAVDRESREILPSRNFPLIPCRLA